MIRRVQLLEAEGPSYVRRLAVIGNGIWDGLLRDNKVMPAVLGFLALLIFAWLIAGAMMGGPGQEEQVSNQASLAQGEDPKSGSSETPAPGVENHDTDSYSAFESKDPFRSLIPKAGEGNNGPNPSPSGGNQGDRSSSSANSKSANSSSGTSKSGNAKSGNSKSANSSSSSSKSVNSKSGSSSSQRPGGEASDQDSIDEPSPSGDQDGGAQSGAPPGGAGGLFNSGGDLPPP
jgi:hypothetical protein